MEQSTYYEVDVLLRLTEMRSSKRLEDSFAWMREEFDARDYEDFNEKYPRGSKGRHKFIAVSNFFELCGVLVNRGLLSEDVFFDIGFGLSHMWQKVKHILPGYCQATDVRLWENFELLYKRYYEWKDSHPPKRKES